MQTNIFRYKSKIKAPSIKLFNLHKNPALLKRLQVPWIPTKIIASGGIENQKKTILKIKFPFQPWRKWVAEHLDYSEGFSFSDIQRKGPFAYWKHTHRFKPQEGNTLLEDEIQYKLPFAFISNSLLGEKVKKDLTTAFAYRHRILAQDTYIKERYPLAPKRILISGCSGLIGQHLIPFLACAGHEIVQLRRSPTITSNDKNLVFWHDQDGFLNPNNLEGIDAVIHLAGDNIASGKWTKAKKDRILESRVRLTSELALAISQLEKPPEVMISASAIGIYGSDVYHATENTRASDDFLAEVCKRWESATEPAQKAGIRVAIPRFGMVLSQDGGALKKLLPLFKKGLGGKIGNGRQFMSWIAIDDVLAIIYFMLANNLVQGAINAITPNPVTNEAFTRLLASTLNRPVGPSVPRIAIKTLYGEMGEATILANSQVYPERLANLEFQFLYPELQDAFAHLLGTNIHAFQLKSTNWHKRLPRKDVGITLE